MVKEKTIYDLIKVNVSQINKEINTLKKSYKDKKIENDKNIDIYFYEDSLFFKYNKATVHVYKKYINRLDRVEINNLENYNYILNYIEQNKNFIIDELKTATLVFKKIDSLINKINRLKIKNTKTLLKIGNKFIYDNEDYIKIVYFDNNHIVIENRRKDVYTYSYENFIRIYWSYKLSLNDHRQNKLKRLSNEK